MLEQFTERARQAVVLATEEARSRRHGAVGPEHLLMGILRDGGGLGIKMLERLRVSPQTLRDGVERLLGETRASTTSGEIGISLELKAVLEATFEEQRQWRHGWIGTEHLVLGLLDERSTARGILRAAGAERE